MGKRGPAKKWEWRMVAAFPLCMKKRIDDVLHRDETRTDFLRTCAEREVNQRLRKKAHAVRAG